VALIGVCALVSLAGTAANASNVSVTIRLHLRSRPDFRSACTVSVPAKSNAIAVLNAAVRATAAHQKKCAIHSYALARDGYFGKDYLSCANDLCDVFSVYWNQFQNGRPQGFVEDFSAASGDNLVFTYEECFCTFPFYG